MIRNTRRSQHDGGQQVYGCIRVVMSDRDVLEHLRGVLGGKPVTEYRNTHGLGSKQLYRWEVLRRADVEVVCAAIYPFIGVRRQVQITKLLEALSTYAPVDSSERVRRAWASRRARPA